MVRGGLFSDVDAVVHWHPSSSNNASPSTSLANKSAKFRFRGISAHAAGAPEEGRSALDGVEAMNHMVNMLREHVPQETRIHYVITAGGHAPNVIPDFAEVYYYVRNPEVELVRSIFERVVKAAEGAAMGNGTRMDYEVIHGLYAMLSNEALQRRAQANLERVGGVMYDDAETAFAEIVQQSLVNPMPLGSAAEVQPYMPRKGGGSTDVADVSWVVPTVGIVTATWVPGTPAHSWQAIAAGGHVDREQGDDRGGKDAGDDDGGSVCGCGVVGGGYGGVWGEGGGRLRVCVAGGGSGTRRWIIGGGRGGRGGPGSAAGTPEPGGG